MTASPKISIVTVCRNAAPMLERTIKSVKSQRYDNKEYIIIDGASTDGSTELAAKADIWRSEPDRGIYDAMNKGLRLASGEWIVFMNAGDTFAADDTLERVAGAILDEDDVVYGDVIKQAANGTMQTTPALPMRNAHRMLFCHQSAFCRREVIAGEPFSLRYPYSADFELFKRLYKSGKHFHRLGFPTAVFDTSGVSNRRRSSGLADNMRVIMATDGIIKGLPLIFHLLPTWLISKLRGK